MVKLADTVRLKQQQDRQPPSSAEDQAQAMATWCCLISYWTRSASRQQLSGRLRSNEVAAAVWSQHPGSAAGSSSRGPVALEFFRNLHLHRLSRPWKVPWFGSWLSICWPITAVLSDNSTVLRPGCQLELGLRQALYFEGLSTSAIFAHQLWELALHA